MKVLATIFLFYFSSLIAQPMVTLLHNGFAKEKVVCTMKCCKQCKQSGKKAPTQKLPFGCCENDMSNPFAQCCCCGGFIPGKQYRAIGLLPYETKEIIANTGSLIPNYYSDCWHPPEAVC